MSYDPTRELYQEFNTAYVKHWKASGGETVTIFTIDQVFSGWAKATDVHFNGSG